MNEEVKVEPKNPIAPRVRKAALFAYKASLHKGMDEMDAMADAIEAALEAARTMSLRDTVEWERVGKETCPDPFSGKPGGRPKYPFWKMEIGETFTITGKHHNTIRASASSYGKRHGKKFTVSTNGDAVVVARTE